MKTPNLATMVKAHFLQTPISHKLRERSGSNVHTIFLLAAACFAIKIKLQAKNWSTSKGRNPFSIFLNSWVARAPILQNLTTGEEVYSNF